MNKVRKDPSREPWIYALISWYLPGVGHYAMGRRWNGILVFLSAFSIALVGVWNIFAPSGNTRFGLSLMLLYYLVSLFVAVRSYYLARNAKRIEEENPTNPPPNRFLAGTASWVIPGLGQLYRRQFMKGISFLALFWLDFYYLNAFSYRYTASLLSAIACYDAATKDSFWRLKTNSLAVKFVVFLLGYSLLTNAGRDIARTWVGLANTNGPSMIPTLETSDVILWMKVREKSLRRGDLVVLDGGTEYTHELVIKRIVAFENESVELLGGKIKIDGRSLDEPPFQRSNYWTDSTSLYVGMNEHYKVPTGAVFVLGDNSAHSLDSRTIGAISQERIKGIVYKIVWPLNRITNLIEP